MHSPDKIERRERTSMVVNSVVERRRDSWEEKLKGRGYHAMRLRRGDRVEKGTMVGRGWTVLQDCLDGRT